jgi:hypothetical protein
MKHATAFPHVEPQKTLSRPPVNSAAITRPPTIDKPQSKAWRPHPEPTGNGELSIDSPDDYTINIRRFANAGAMAASTFTAIFPAGRLNSSSNGWDLIKIVRFYEKP